MVENHATRRASLWTAPRHVRVTDRQYLQPANLNLARLTEKAKIGGRFTAYYKKPPGSRLLELEHSSPMLGLMLIRRGYAYCVRNPARPVVVSAS